MRLQVKVVPGSSRDSVEGWLDDVLKLRVAAPPERGKANAAVERLIARAVGIRKSAVKVVSGQSSTRKTLELADVTEAAVFSRLPTRT